MSKKSQEQAEPAAPAPVRCTHCGHDEAAHVGEAKVCPSFVFKADAPAVAPAEGEA